VIEFTWSIRNVASGRFLGMEPEDKVSNRHELREVDHCFLWHLLGGNHDSCIRYINEDTIVTGLLMQSCPSAWPFLSQTTSWTSVSTTGDHTRVLFSTSITIFDGVTNNGICVKVREISRRSALLPVHLRWLRFTPCDFSSAEERRQL
jgi:hypothetical protein